ncbi:MAG: AraC family ligand binding domain-containing protein, partial [Bacteroidota bacterium]
MEAIRIEKLGQAFRYARMEEIEAKQPSHQEKPHRHDYYAVLLVEQAEGTHHIDFRTYPLHPRTVFFLSPEQVHHVGLTAPSPRGQVLLFTEDFLQQYCLPMAQFNELDLFFNCDETPPLPLDAQAFQEVASWGQTIRQEYEAQAWHWEATVGTWLRLILLRCQRVKHHLRHDAPQKISRQAEIMRQFKAELSTHFTQLHQVKAYAERLN